MPFLWVKPTFQQYILRTPKPTETDSEVYGFLLISFTDELVMNVYVSLKKSLRNALIKIAPQTRIK